MELLQDGGVNNWMWGLQTLDLHSTLLQLLKMMQLCFAVKLQECFVG